jgi:hypothetical protein
MTNNSTRVWLPALLLASACKMQMMPAGPGLAPEAPFSRGTFDRGSLRFGAYQIAGFKSDSGGEVTTGGDVLPDFMRHVTTVNAYDDFRFELEPGDHQVRCTAETSKTTVHEHRFSISSTEGGLRCAIWLTPGGDYARLELDRNAQALTIGSRTLVVQPRNIAGQPDMAMDAGYGIVENGRDVAVVQRDNGGAVWLARDADEGDRALYAAAAAVLLLYQQPD